MKRLFMVVLMLCLFSVIPFTANASTGSSAQQILGPSTINVTSGDSVNIRYTDNGTDDCIDWSINWMVDPSDSYLNQYSDGLNVANAGYLYGHPMGHGTYHFQVWCLGDNYQWLNKNISLNVFYPADITTLSIPYGRFNVNYKVYLKANQPVKGLQWRVLSGFHLPPGLHLSPAGTIYGKPTKTGTYRFTIAVVYPGNRAWNYATRSYTMKIHFNEKDITTLSIPNGRYNVNYIPFHFKVDKPVKGLTWVAKTALPEGLHLSAAGTLYGKPAVNGIYHVKIAVGYPYKGTFEYVDQDYTLTITN